VLVAFLTVERLELVFIGKSAIRALLHLLLGPSRCEIDVQNSSGDILSG
jgi:hypothetical protein